MPLTDTVIKNAKPKEIDVKLADEKGMYLLIKKSGAKCLGLIIVLPEKERP